MTPYQIHSWAANKVRNKQVRRIMIDLGRRSNLLNGSNMMLDLHLSDQVIIRVRTNRGVNYSIGSKINFDLDPQMVRFFNPATEAALVME